MNVIKRTTARKPKTTFFCRGLVFKLFNINYIEPSVLQKLGQDIQKIHVNFGLTTGPIL